MFTEFVFVRKTADMNKEAEKTFNGIDFILFIANRIDKNNNMIRIDKNWSNKFDPELLHSKTIELMNQLSPFKEHPPQD